MSGASRDGSSLWSPGLEVALLAMLSLVAASTGARRWTEWSAGLMAKAHDLFLSAVKLTSLLDESPLGALPAWLSFGDEPLGLLEAPLAALVASLCFGLAVVASRGSGRRWSVASRPLAVVEWCLSWLALAFIPWILVTAVSVAPRRVMAGLLLLWCFSSARRRPDGAWWRGTAATLAVLIPTWCVAIDRLGSLPTSPLFSPGGLWLSGPGRSPWLSGLVWVGLGVTAWLVADRRSGLAPPPPRRTLISGAAIALLAFTHGGQAGTGVTEVLGSLAVLLLARALGSAVGPVGVSRSEVVRALIDSRALLRAVLPGVALAAFGTMQALTAAMWTRPLDQAGVTHLSDTDNVFGIGVDRTSGDVWYTVRSTWTIGRIDPDGEERLWTPGPPDPHRWDTETGVEQIYEAPDGSLWINLRRDGDDSGFTVVGAGREPGDYLAVPRCLTAAWRNLSDDDARGLGGLPGDVLLGCEYQRSVLLYRPTDGSVVRRLEVRRGVDGVVPLAGGSRMAMVSCWGKPDVHLLEVESGVRLADRIVGPVNFSIEQGPGGDLWVPQHMHGVLLGLEPTHLDVHTVVPLSFGLRMVRYDKDRRRFWVTAPLSGVVWAVDADPPHARTAFRVCGMARDVAIDPRDGTAVTGTHCGIFRLDAEAARAGG